MIPPKVSPAHAKRRAKDFGTAIASSSSGPYGPIVQARFLMPSGKEIIMLKVFAVLMLAALGVTLVGCKASADVDPHGATSVLAPQ